MAEPLIIGLHYDMTLVEGLIFKGFWAVNNSWITVNILS